MTTTVKHWRCAIVLSMSAIGIVDHSEPVYAAENPGWWPAAKDHVTSVVDEGSWDLYLSGYAYHNRETYDAKRIRKLNEKAWGGGIGKTILNTAGNEESLYLIGIRDSNRNLQWTAGYAYQWKWPVGDGGFKVGTGLTAAVIRRKDWYDGIPFPAVLPVFSAGVRSAQLTATYVPRLSMSHGKGDVLLIMLKYSF